MAGDASLIDCAAIVVHRTGQTARLARWWTRRRAATSRLFCRRLVQTPDSDDDGDDKWDDSGRRARFGPANQDVVEHHATERDGRETDDTEEKPTPNRRWRSVAGRTNPAHAVPCERDHRCRFDFLVLRRPATRADRTHPVRGSQRLTDIEWSLNRGRLRCVRRRRGTSRRRTREPETASTDRSTCQRNSTALRAIELRAHGGYALRVTTEPVFPSVVSTCARRRSSFCGLGLHRSSIQRTPEDECDRPCHRRSIPPRCTGTSWPGP